MFDYLKTDNGHYLAQFLHDSVWKCDYDGALTDSCKTIEKYMNSGKVTYKNVILIDDKEEIPTISEYKSALLTALVSQLNSYFPDGNLDNFDVFDPKKCLRPKIMSPYEHMVW